MSSFAQRFGLTTKDSGNNSIQQEIILETMRDAQESLAEQMSESTRSADNLASILTPQEENLAEPDTDTLSLTQLLKAIDDVTSLEELSTLVQHYEELLQSWSEKAATLRSKEHLKEYLSITAALSMLQKMIQQPGFIVGKTLSETLHTNLLTQQKPIEHQINTLLAEQPHVRVSHLANIAPLLHTPAPLATQDAAVRHLHHTSKPLSAQDIAVKHTHPATQHRAEIATVAQLPKNQNPKEQTIPHTTTPSAHITQQPQETRTTTTLTVVQPLIQPTKVQTQPQEKLIPTAIAIQPATAKQSLPLLPKEISTTKPHDHPQALANSTYKPLARDTLSHAHICTASCNHTQAVTAPQPKALGTDTVSKAQAHGPGCGCSSCSGHQHITHQHQPQPQQPQPQPQPTPTPPAHEHGPSCSCCGHGARATEIQTSQHMARIN